MAYVKYCVMEKIFEKCTDAELAVALYIVRFMNWHGDAPGILMKDVCKATGISKSRFYEVRDSLVKKGIFIVSETKWQKGWNFQLVDNVIRAYENKLFEKDIIGGYVNLDNKNFLYTKEFLKGTCKNEKKLALMLLRFMNGNDKEPSQGEKDKAYAKYDVYKKTLMKWVKVTDPESIGKYIKTLSKWFVFEKADKKKKGLLYIHLKKENYKKEYESNIYQIVHKIKIQCRRFKIAWSDKILKDIIGLIIQYYHKGLNMVVSMIMDTAFIGRKLNPKLAHARIKKRIEEKKIEEQKQASGRTEPAGGYKFKEPNHSGNTKLKEGLLPKARTFNNFKNREYDSEVLEKWLLQRSGMELTDPEPAK